MKKLKCSFCGRSETEVKKLIAGPGGRGSKPAVYICDKCIEIAKEIISKGKPTDPVSPFK